MGNSENHQEKNAEELVKKNAAQILHDKDLSEKLESTIMDLINNEAMLSTMRNNIKQFADKKAAEKIASLLIKMVNTSKN